MSQPESLVYKTTPQGDLRLYFYGPDGQRTDGRTPAVLFFFGGGWNQGNPDQFRRQAQHLADRGIVGVTADYRTRNRHGTTPFDALADAITAMRTLRANAETLGLDPDRLGAAGGSAGGHLAAALATVTADDLIPDDDGLADSPFRPAALVLFNPVYDNGPDGYAHDRIGERYVDFSPAHNL
ncbi:MAG: alpha/beta hydrolase fold domain-containing protein, partial [Planctomycetota bacterium]